MFEDARKTAGFEKDFVVEDIAELVARAIELDAFSLHELPGLADKISAAIADRVANAVSDRLEVVLSNFMLAAPAAVPTVALSGEVVAAAVEAQKVIAAAAQPWQARPLAPADLPAWEIPEKTGARILVPIKRVGKLGDEFVFSEDQRSIPDEYLEYQLNEWDDTALEQALKTVEALGGGEVVVVTIGPENAEETLRKALAKGADRGVRVWSKGLDGADPLVIARLLAGVAAREQPDLIFTGAQSSDMANASTGAALARLLDLPRAAMVVATEWDGSGVIGVTRELEGGLLHQVEIDAPAVVAMQTGANTPRYATMRMIKLARAKPIAVVDAAPDDWQAARISRLYTPEVSRAAMIEGSAEEVAAKVIAIIRDKMGDPA